MDFLEYIQYALHSGYRCNFTHLLDICERKNTNHTFPEILHYKTQVDTEQSRFYLTNMFDYRCGHGPDFVTQQTCRCYCTHIITYMSVLLLAAHNLTYEKSVSAAVLMVTMTTHAARGGVKSAITSLWDPPPQALSSRAASTAGAAFIRPSSPCQQWEK